MLSLSSKLPKLAAATLVVALGLMGWVGKATLAQVRETEPAPAQPPAAGTVAPSAPQDLDVPKVEAAASPPPLVVIPPEIPANSLGLAPATAARPEVVTHPDVDRIPGTAIAQPTGNDPEDPEKEAVVFLEHNQKVAESELQKLKAEEAKLRARLQKVEAGIKRWETLVGALKQSKGSVAVATPGHADGWKHATPAPHDPESSVGAPAVPKR